MIVIRNLSVEVSYLATNPANTLPVFVNLKYFNLSSSAALVILCRTRACRTICRPATTNSGRILLSADYFRRSVSGI